MTDYVLLFMSRFNKLGARYMLGGSVAAMFYGDIRQTRDVDVVVTLDSSHIEELPRLFPPPEFYCPPPEAIKAEAARAQRGHFTIIHISSGFKADVYMSGRDPHNHWGLEKAIVHNYEGVPVLVAPPEYIITKKLEYYREGGSEKHLNDIRAMLTVSPDAVKYSELRRLISEKRLEEQWEKVQEGLI